jgi:hypothetical protein
MIEFLDELIEQFPKEAQLILARLYLSTQVGEEDLMKAFITEVLPLKNVIEIRDEKFFLESNANVLQKCDSSILDHFRLLWKSSALDDDDKEVIWKWFDMFILLSENYQKSLIEDREGKEEN